MIVKKVKNENDKPKAWQIGDLVDYIRHPHNRNPQEKIEYAGGRHFITATHTGQKLEMITLARESAHSKMPVTHWIFSWQEGEQPSHEQVDELVELFLEKMGLTGLQTVYALHWNTENYHVHIAVNRMNPETGKTVQPNEGFDIEVGHQIVAEIEKRQGWMPEKNARYSVDAQGKIQRKKQEKSGPKPKDKALSFEAATGEKSAQRIAQERGHSRIKNAKTWAELHEKLVEVGLRFEKKGSGAILFVGEIAVKASSVDRDFSMKKLIKKLGDFEPGNYGEIADKIEPEPVSAVNLEEWEEYQEERRQAQEAAEKTVPIPAENPALAVLKTKHQKQRERLLSRVAKQGFAALNIARHSLAKQQREELRHLRMEEMTTPRRGVPRFEKWLRERGLHRKADLWRYRNRHPQKITPPPLKRTPDTIAAYVAHQENLRRKIAEKSRRDAMIALRLRATGHSREDVAETMRQNAPEDQTEIRDWNRYAERATAYAFGVAGDLELAARLRFLEQWKLIEAVEKAPDAPKPPEPEPATPESETPRRRMR
jgi:hypothetical protein